jgi:hypothetical protein
MEPAGYDVSASRLALDQDWRILRTTHRNVLVVGTDVVVDDALRTLRCACRQPVVTCWASDPLVLPSPPSSGTLILRGVDTLSLDSQRRLLAWLDDAHGCTQVISTSARALWPRLETAAFLDALYYRLNVVYFDLTRQEHGEIGMHPTKGNACRRTDDHS